MRPIQSERQHRERPRPKSTSVVFSAHSENKHCTWKTPLSGCEEEPRVPSRVSTSEPVSQGEAALRPEREAAEGTAAGSPWASGGEGTVRQLERRPDGPDGSPPATRVSAFQVDALPEVAAAVNGSVEVYVDGGIRTGTDVLKALALGAQCVFLGRPILWGLACKVRPATRKPAEGCPCLVFIRRHAFLWFDPQPWPFSRCHGFWRDSRFCPARISVLRLQQVENSHELSPRLVPLAYLDPRRSSPVTDHPTLPATSLSTPRIYAQRTPDCSFMLLFCLPAPLPCEKGQRGVEEVLNILKDEFHTSMELSGECVRLRLS